MWQEADDYKERKVFQPQQSSCTDELTDDVTLCTRSEDTRARQNPCTEVGSGDNSSQGANGNC